MIVRRRVQRWKAAQPIDVREEKSKDLLPRSFIQAVDADDGKGKSDRNDPERQLNASDPIQDLTRWIALHHRAKDSEDEFKIARAARKGATIKIARAARKGATNG